MAHSPLLLCLMVACTTVSGFSLQDSHSYESRVDQALSGEGREISIPSLSENVEEISSDSSSFRFKRHAMKNRRDFPRCCGGDSNEFTEETSKLYENCKQQLNKGEDASGAGMCGIAVCVGKAKGVLDADGFVKEAEFVQLIQEAYADESLKAVAKAAGPECAKKANDAAKPMMDNPQQGNGCNWAAIAAYHCVTHEVLLNCPADKIVNSQECIKHRQMMQQWKDSQGNKTYT